jgi:GDP-mannose pyrophosphatase NudK
MSKIKITQTKQLSNQRFQLNTYTYLKPNVSGKMQEHNAEVYFRPDAVALLLYDENERKFLLTRQFRFPTYLNQNPDGYIVEVCAGLIDEGETPVQAVIREAKEEVGYTVTSPENVGAYYTSAGGITELIHLFIAPYDANQPRSGGGGLPEEGEEIDILELDFDEALQLIKENKLNDAKTVMLLQHYFLFR